MLLNFYKIFNFLGKEKEKLSKYGQSFVCKKAPSISIEAYLERICKYTQIEESTLVLCLIYIDRFCDISKFSLSENNIHR